MIYEKEGDIQSQFSARKVRNEKKTAYEGGSSTMTKSHGAGCARPNRESVKDLPADAQTAVSTIASSANTVT